MLMILHIYLLLLLNVLRTLDAVDVEFSSDPDEHWANFKKAFQKEYKEEEEEAVKRKNFEDNFKRITEHNRRYEQGIHSFQIGFNEYADLALLEFIEMMNGFIPGENIAPIPFVAPTDAQINDTVDWRKEGAVTPVKNQESCGSCYAFSATGGLEGQHFLRRGKLISLSEQNIVDCSRREGNLGCAGGQMDAAFEYVMVNNGIDTEKSYPYVEKEGRCKYRRKNSATSCKGYSDITPRNEDTLKTAVAYVGPMSCGIDASHDSFQLYTSGIYNEPNCSSTSLDHGILVVGYGTEGGQDYWLVKNSWGTSWGENGYIKMSRNKDNQCGIATQCSFPVI